MFERFTAESRAVLTRANAIARELRHNFIGTEHLLLGLDGTPAGDLLTGLGMPPDQRRQAVIEVLGTIDAPASSQTPFTPRAKKVLEFSLREALARGDNEIRPEHILLSLLRIGEGVACEVLTQAGITYQAIEALIGAPTPGRRTFRWRRPFYAPEYPPPAGMVGDATPGARGVPLTARRLAGNEPVSTYHYLRALLNEGVAGRILEALGVTPQAVTEKFGELGTAGTSDEMDVPIDLGGKTYRLPPEEAARLQALLDLGPQERKRKLGGL